MGFSLQSTVSLTFKDKIWLEWQRPSWVRCPMQPLKTLARTAGTQGARLLIMNHWIQDLAANSSVPDPWRVETDPDLDPWIWTLDYRSGSCSFRFPEPTKHKFFFFVFCLLLTVGVFTSVFNDRKSLKVAKTLKSRFFLIILLVDGRIWIRICEIKIWMQEAQKCKNPTDPD